MTQTKFGLAKEQVRQYHQQGWLGPFSLISEAEMAEVRRKIEAEILDPGKQQGLDERDYFHNRHLDNRCIYELLSHPNLVEKAASILGGHLVLWRTNFQIKLPRSQQDDWDTVIPWHQDCAYYQPSPNVILSAWIAVDEANRLMVACKCCLKATKGSILILRPKVPIALVLGQTQPHLTPV